MISKEIFVSVIERLRQQYLQDKEYSDSLNLLYGVDNMSLYDNSNLVKSCFDLLRIWFPKDEDGHCDIEHYCYVCDFGKVGDLDSSELLWELLVGKVNPIEKNESKEIQDCIDCFTKNNGKRCPFCITYFKIKK